MINDFYNDIRYGTMRSLTLTPTKCRESSRPVELCGRGWSEAYLFAVGF